MALYSGHFDFTEPLLQTLPELFTADERRMILANATAAEWLPGIHRQG